MARDPETGCVYIFAVGLVVFILLLVALIVWLNGHPIQFP